jgi:hypothetical protein
MNIHQFEELKKVVPDFVDNYCFWLPVDKIKQDASSQVRRNSHVYSAVPRMMADIEVNGQRVPCDVRALTNGQHKLEEGNTRYISQERLGNDVWVCDYFDKLKYTANEWADHQVIANDHPICTPNSDDDIEKAIAARIDDGRADQIVGCKYQGNEKEWVKKFVEHLQKKLYVNSGRTKVWFTNRVGKALDGAKQYEFISYDTTSAFNLIRQANPFRWNGKGIGVVSNNVTFYVAGKTDKLTPNCLGNAAWKKIENPGVDIYFACWEERLVGTSEQDIVDKRDAFKDKFDKINKRFPDLFAGMFVLPQIKNGPNKENLHTIIKTR